MKKQLYVLLAAVSVLVFACQKELSFEGSNQPAEGSLQSDALGDCLPKTVNGTYTAGIELVPATNTISVQVNVTRTGNYTITTDTVNGYYFKATGIFTTLGINNVTMRGYGTPFASGTNNFVVSFSGTVCDIQVTVTQPGVGTLAGSPGSCAPITVSGNYAPGATMGVSQTATVQVNVTTAGALNIRTDTVAGIWFSYTGNFGMGTNQNVVLQAQGTIPAGETTGPKLFTVKLGSSSCTFTVNVAPVSTGTVNCSGATPAGLYMEGVELEGSDTVRISVNVTTVGSYTISTDTLDSPTDGFWFSASGVFNTTGNTTVTLVGHGTPHTANTYNFTVKYGSSTCTFPCTVVAADYFPRTTNSNWSYEFDDDANDSLLRYVKNVPPLAVGANNFTIFMENDGSGEDSSGYYRKNGGDYFEWMDVGSYLNYDNPVWGEYIMLKDNVPVGTVWKSTGFAGTVTIPPAPSQNLNTRFSFKILQKDVPVSVTSSAGTVTYNKVIVVEEKIELEITPGIWQDVTAILDRYGVSYYARGKGLIMYEEYNAANVLQAGKQELRRSYVY